MSAGVVFLPGRVQLLVMGARGVQAAERDLAPGLAGAARAQAWSAALRELAQELGLRPGTVVHAAVPRSEAIVRRLQAPPVAEAELGAIVGLQARKDLPFEPAEVELAWCRSDTPNEVVFAAVRRPALEELRAAVTGAGLAMGRLEVSSQAAARAVRLLGPSLEDVGGKSSGTGLIKKVAGETLLLLLEPRQVEVLVLAAGRPPFARAAALSEETQAVGLTERLVAELLRTLGTFRAERGKDPGVAPARLLLAGSGAGTPGLREALGERLGCPAELLSGLDPSAGVDAAQGARFLLARGLADPRRIPGLEPLDLGHHARAAATRDLKRRATLSGAGALALVLILLVGARLVLASRVQEIEALEAERQAMQAEVREAKRLQGELERARAWGERRGRELEVLLLVSRALPGEDAYLTQLRWTEGAEVRLAGRAKEWEAVGQLFSGLERDPRVERATYDDIRRPPEKDALGVQFSGSARLRGERAGTP